MKESKKTALFTVKTRIRAGEGDESWYSGTVDTMSSWGKSFADKMKEWGSSINKSLSS